MMNSETMALAGDMAGLSEADYAALLVRRAEREERQRNVTAHLAATARNGAEEDPRASMVLAKSSVDNRQYIVDL